MQLNRSTQYVNFINIKIVKYGIIFQEDVQSKIFNTKVLMKTKHENLASNFYSIAEPRSSVITISSE